MSGDLSESEAAQPARVPAMMAERAIVVRHGTTLSGGTVALLALALGAGAIGAIAIGRLAIGSLTAGRVRIKHGDVQELRIARLVIGDLRIERRLER